LEDAWNVHQGISLLKIIKWEITKLYQPNVSKDYAILDNRFYLMDSAMTVQLIPELKIIIKNVVLISVIIHKFLMRKENVFNVGLILKYKLELMARESVIKINVLLINMY